MVPCDDKLSTVHPIKVGVPQGSILAPTLYNIFTADIPHSNDTTLTTFVDDTGVISTNLDIKMATKNHQNHLSKLQHWFKSWRINQTTLPLVFVSRTVSCIPKRKNNP